ncbi:MAG: FAD-binding oxidoreductase, partial [Microthrixaceae bacterium]
MAGQDVFVPDPDIDAAGDLAELAAELARPLLSGPDAVAHETPWRGAGGSALAVAKPVELDEVREVVRWARRTRTRILPQGAVTGLVGASTPPATGPPPLVLSTDALDGRLDIDPGDAVAIVDAGVRLSALNGKAADLGLELPIDLAADPSVGAMVATNTGGSRVLAHGDMSRHVLGIQAVIANPDATVIGNLSGLRKDNTGPDATKLLIGSGGAFGVITAVAVALTPV